MARCLFCEQLRRSRQLPWLLVGLVASSLIFASAIAARKGLRYLAISKQLTLANTRLETVADTRRKAATKVKADCDADADFTSHLPALPQIRGIVSEVDRSSSAHHVSVGSVQRQEILATSEQLGRVDVTIVLRGEYPQVKAVVLDLLGRFSNVTLSQWLSNREGQTTEIESTLSFAVWTAPRLPQVVERPVGAVGC